MLMPAERRAARKDDRQSSFIAEAYSMGVYPAVHENNLIAKHTVIDASNIRAIIE
jgi:Leu/Phe-tRNA-protein transferase